MNSILGTINLPYKFEEVYKSHIFTMIHLTPDSRSVVAHSVVAPEL